MTGVGVGSGASGHLVESALLLYWAPYTHRYSCNCMYVCIMYYVCMYVLCMYVCMYIVCMYVYIMYVCVCVCVCVCVSLDF